MKQPRRELCGEGGLPVLCRRACGAKAGYFGDHPAAEAEGRRVRSGPMAAMNAVRFEAAVGCDPAMRAAAGAGRLREQPARGGARSGRRAAAGRGRGGVAHHHDRVERTGRKGGAGDLGADPVQSTDARGTSDARRGSTRPMWRRRRGRARAVRYSTGSDASVPVRFPVRRARADRRRTLPRRRSQSGRPRRRIWPLPDPTGVQAALIEVIATALGQEFRDGYLDLPLGLPGALLLATATSLSTVPATVRGSGTRGGPPPSRALRQEEVTAERLGDAGGAERSDEPAERVARTCWAIPRRLGKVAEGLDRLDLTGMGIARTPYSFRRLLQRVEDDPGRTSPGRGWSGSVVYSVTNRVR